MPTKAIGTLHIQMGEDNSCPSSINQVVSGSRVYQTSNRHEENDRLDRSENTVAMLVDKLDMVLKGDDAKQSDHSKAKEEKAGYEGYNCSKRRHRSISCKEPCGYCGESNQISHQCATRLNKQKTKLEKQEYKQRHEKSGNDTKRETVKQPVHVVTTTIGEQAHADKDQGPILVLGKEDIETRKVVKKGVKRQLAEAEESGQANLAAKLKERYYKQLENLKKAREAKARYRQMDQKAVARGETPPSLLSKATKAFPMIIGPDQRIQKFDIKQAVWKAKISVPLPQFLYHSPTLYHDFLEEGVGIPSPLKKLENNVGQTVHMVQKMDEEHGPIVINTKRKTYVKAL